MLESFGSLLMPSLSIKASYNGIFFLLNVSLMSFLWSEVEIFAAKRVQA